ncbi:MAG: hypothetical protein C0508_07585 [Cyanobacteria bacterium PR.023]|nr:hypothetical protein [Cyanobacteria bacterium PR.023]
MRKQVLRYTLILALLELGISCNCALAKQYVARRDVEILVSDDGSAKKIRIEIWAGGCLQDFGAVKTQVRDDTLRLVIPLHSGARTLLKKKLTQFKDIHIVVPDGVKCITLAGDGCEIWPRDGGARVRSSGEQQALDIATQKFLKEFNRANMNRVTTNVSERELRLTHEPGYCVLISPRDTNKRIYYYLNKKNFSLVDRVEMSKN